MKKDKLQIEPPTPKNPVKDLPGVYNRHVLLMHLTTRIMAERLEAHYAKKGVGIRDVWIMMAARNSDKNQKEIAEGVGINLNVMVGLVDKLEKKGLLRRKQNPQNRRERLLVLTEKGCDFVRWADEDYPAFAKDLFYPMPEDRLENFRVIMKAIVARYYGDEQEMWVQLRKREEPHQPYPTPPEMPEPKK